MSYLKDLTLMGEKFKFKVELHEKSMRGKFVGQSPFIRIIAFFAVAFIATGCPNNQGPDGISKAVSSAKGTSSTGGTLANVTDEGFITITKAVRSNQDTNSLIELVGVSGEIGTQCPTKDDCECLFSWTTQDPFNANNSGILREAPQAPDHVENNMLRCLFTQVDQDAQYYDVKIHIKQGDLFSNTLRVFMSSPNPSLDPSIAANYLQVQRFMCRDMFGKANNTAKYTNLVDPVLWGSKYSFTYNFYTTSFGKDYGATAVSNSDGSSTEPSGYECPTVPNDPSDGMYNLTLLSEVALDVSDPNRINVPSNEGDKTIYPSDDNQNLAAAKCATGTESTCEKFIANRHDFYLATFRSGTYKTPVCIVHKVGNFVQGGLACDFDTDKGAITLGSTALGTKGKDIIGFAAVPDTNQSCPNPNLVTLPSGKKWAKLWQFRRSRGPRTISDIANPSDVGQLFCTTKGKECKSTQIINLDAGAVDPNSVCQWPRAGGAIAGASLITASGPGIGPQQTQEGYGNCYTKGTTGDGNTYVNGGWDFSGLPCTSNQGLPLVAGPDEFNCCLDVNYNGGKTVANGNNTKPANFTPGGDYCNPALSGSTDATADGGLAQDVWLMGNGNKQACIEADTNNQGAIKNPAAFPPSVVGLQKPVFTMSDRPLETDSKYDRVYVITPTTVTIEQMQDPEHNPVAKKYHPIATSGPKYELELGTELVAPNQNRLSKFPLCVLQDTKQGATQ